MKILVGGGPDGTHRRRKIRCSGCGETIIIDEPYVAAVVCDACVDRWFEQDEEEVANR